MKLLFVCLGNICRSPTAEAVMRSLSEQYNGTIELDSAGTAAYHIGKSPDPRTCKAAKLRNISMEGMSARQVTTNDFYEFDYIFAMDRSNYQDLMAMRPADSKAHLGLFLKEYGTMGVTDVPDPYYGGEQGFETVLDLLHDACEHFLEAKTTR